MELCVEMPGETSLSVVSGDALMNTAAGNVILGLEQLEVALPKEKVKIIRAEHRGGAPSGAGGRATVVGAALIPITLRGSTGVLKFMSLDASVPPLLLPSCSTAWAIDLKSNHTTWEALSGASALRALGSEHSAFFIIEKAPGCPITVPCSVSRQPKRKNMTVMACGEDPIHRRPRRRSAQLYTRTNDDDSVAFASAARPGTAHGKCCSGHQHGERLRGNLRRGARRSAGHGSRSGSETLRSLFASSRLLRLPVPLDVPFHCPHPPMHIVHLANQDAAWAGAPVAICASVISRQAGQKHKMEKRGGEAQEELVAEKIEQGVGEDQILGAQGEAREAQQRATEGGAARERGQQQRHGRAPAVPTGMQRRATAAEGWVFPILGVPGSTGPGYRLTAP